MAETQSLPKQLRPRQAVFCLSDFDLLRSKIKKLMYSPDRNVSVPLEKTVSADYNKL